MTTPFPEDDEHASYDTDAAGRYLTALQWSADVLDEFAGWSSLKTSPVQVFWHGLDLAVTRFSGRPAPASPDVDAVTAEAYSHEVVSFGFWPGDRDVRYPAYYSYTAPEPTGLRDEPLRPAAAAWAEQRGGSLALLPLRRRPCRPGSPPDPPDLPAERLGGGLGTGRLGRHGRGDAVGAVAADVLVPLGDRRWRAGRWLTPAPTSTRPRTSNRRAPAARTACAPATAGCTCGCA
jgi:hypothetical protein